MTYNLCPVSKKIALLAGPAICSVSRRLQLQLPGTDVAQLSQNMSGDSPVKSHQAGLSMQKVRLGFREGNSITVANCRRARDVV